MGFKAGTTDLPELTTGGLSITKAATTATSDSSNAVSKTQNGVRAGSIVVTMDTGHSIAANTGFMVATITCDEVAATDVIVCNAVNCDDGTDDIATGLSCDATFIEGGVFKILILQQSSVAVPAAGRFTLNWAII